MTTKTPPTRAGRPTRPPKATTPAPVPDRRRADAVTRRDVVVLAVVVGAHGLGGELRVKSFTDDLAAYRVFNDGALTLRSARGQAGAIIVRFAEIANRDAAEALRGTELTVPREALPPLAEGEYYHADLLGLPAVTTGGEPLGIVVAVDDFGAGDVIEIERPTGKRFMVPMRPPAVPDWSDERLVVDPAFAAE